MEDRQTPLNKLRSKVLCTRDGKCWCNGVDTKFAHDGDQCLSPQEMLDHFEARLTRRDAAYLKTLTSKEFVPNE